MKHSTLPCCLQAVYQKHGELLLLTDRQEALQQVQQQLGQAQQQLAAARAPAGQRQAQ